MLTPLTSPALFNAPVSHVSVGVAYEAYSDAAAAALRVRLPEKMDRAVPKRKAEYVAGRFCAAHAMRALLGGFDHSLHPSSSGPPVWPDGLVGSITHTRGFAAAAIARIGDARGLGIDTERIMAEEVMREVATAICAAGERFSPRTGLSETAYATLVFSAKESVFKCIHPLVRKMFWFQDARVEIVDPAEGRFRATLLIDLDTEFRAGAVLDGHYRIARPYVHTGVLLAA
jgi:enterobactin synthetase component D